MPKDMPLAVEFPAPGADRPPWAKVGIIAAVGFVFGILWPRLTNTRIAPNPPNDSGPAAAAAVSAPAAGSASPAAS
ncbi:MAG TPA: SH3 domain-containing protein, partial [Polyangiaceae bacterium]|nr:SH3 domain-containing protein [Polyangiaceae bacterium]